MKRLLRLPALPVIALLAIVLGALASGVFAENIDPANDNSQFAWGENIGWLNAEPSGDGGPGITVGATTLTGYMWGENAGWISMNCANTGSCGSVNYYVYNDGTGVLSGWAWSENAGWINFSCQTQNTCGSVNFGVTINMGTGVFSGQAWGENIGWITFNCSTTSTCGSVPYQVRTGWPAGAADSDGDGCPDAAEQVVGTGAELTGGNRDYLNPYDYFNPTNDGTIRVDDILAVVGRYFSSGNPAGPLNTIPPAPPAYHAKFDRAPLGPNVWNLTQGNGIITIPDILAVIAQYFHDCGTGVVKT